MDLVLLRVGENIAMRGLGGCRFEPANAAWGFDGGDGWSTALAATWEKGADWPTIAIGNYIDRKEETIALGLLHRQLAAPAEVRRWICSSGGAETQLLSALDDVHGLGSLRHAKPARVQ